MRNLTVVIADDDRLVLQDLRNMVNWEKLGFSIAGTAASGEEAFALVDREKPSLLITDIQMLGGMNGLDVIELAHEKYRHMKFLVISSYDDFHYLKRAMAAGVVDYILKTDISPAALTAKLLDVKHRFSQDSRDSIPIIGSQLRQYLEEREPEMNDLGRYTGDHTHAAGPVPPAVMHNDQARKCITDPAPELYPALVPLAQSPYYFMLCGRSQLFTKGQEDAPYDQNAGLDQLMPEIYQQALNYDVFPLVCRFDRAILVGISAEMVSGFALRDFSSAISYLYGAGGGLLQLYCERAMTIGEFRSYICPLRPLVRYHLFFIPAQRRALPFDSIAELTHVPVTEDFPFHALVFDSEHREQNILLLKSYIETCCRSYDSRALERFFRSFCFHLALHTNNQLALPESLHAETPEAFQKWIYNRLEEAVLLLTNGVEKGYSPKVEAAVRFMTQHYAQPDISSAEIAEATGLSVSRLGILIKQETGRTINEYLAQIRIEKAVELLEKTNLKIYEIADRCGYKSSQYFSQVFFQKTGRKPIDYRKGGVR